MRSDSQQADKQLQEQQRSFDRILNQTQSDIQQSQNRLEEQKRGYQSLQRGGELALLDNRKQLKELDLQITALSTEIAQTKNQIKSLKFQLQQRTLRAPSNGVITEMPIEKSQAYIQPGQLVAQIAPQDAKLILKAQMPSEQSGFLRVGLPVKVKFDAYPFQDYGIVSGRVISVAPDSKILETPQGKIEVFDLEIALDKNSEMLNAKQNFTF